MTNISSTVSEGLQKQDCVKNVSIWSYSGPYFPEFGLESEKMRIKITPNTDTFCAVQCLLETKNGQIQNVLAIACQHLHRSLFSIKVQTFNKFDHFYSML